MMKLVNKFFVPEFDVDEMKNCKTRNGLNPSERIIVFKDNQRKYPMMCFAEIKVDGKISLIHWNCYGEATRRNVRLKEFDLIRSKEIQHEIFTGQMAFFGMLGWFLAVLYLLFQLI